MARFIKHVGTHRDTGSKLVVVFRKLPDDASRCLVVETQTLPDKFHDELLQAVESITAQQEADLYNYLNRNNFFTGKAMLLSLHEGGFLKRMDTNQVRMTPQQGVEIMLDELNRQLDNIANSQTNNAPGQQALGDDEIARRLISQAEFYEKEAQRLRQEARELTGEPERKGPGRPRKAPVTETAQA